MRRTRLQEFRGHGDRRQRVQAPRLHDGRDRGVRFDRCEGFRVVAGRERRRDRVRPLRRAFAPTAATAIAAVCVWRGGVHRQRCGADAVRAGFHVDVAPFGRGVPLEGAVELVEPSVQVERVDGEADDVGVTDGDVRAAVGAEQPLQRHDAARAVPLAVALGAVVADGAVGLAKAKRDVQLPLNNDERLRLEQPRPLRRRRRRRRGVVTRRVLRRHLLFAQDLAAEERILAPAETHGAEHARVVVRVRAVVGVV
mmetsp:Transcript_6635/g.20831  ORF Transcript_6635/g.20831 Transcript_6635/m.20831 type:complete len:254 (-) Transcript_6635:664-1425(-)